MEKEKKQETELDKEISAQKAKEALTVFLKEDLKD